MAPDIHFETHGDRRNPPVLLIMGLALSSKAWERLPHILAERFFVITFDNRGTGRSVRRGVAYRMRQLADDAAAVLDAVGVPSAHVFGISMGGMVAQELALRHPERVLSLALGCTLASWRRGVAPDFRTKWDFFKMHFGRNQEARLGRLLVSPAWHAKNPGKTREWLIRAERTALRFMVAQVLAVTRHNTLKRLWQIRAPTLLMTGSDDRIIPPRNSEMLVDAIPGARLQIFEGAGHCFPIEQEEATVRALTDHFLRAQPQYRSEAIL